jgi:Tfp pilus assembly protein PilX
MGGKAMSNPRRTGAPDPQAGAVTIMVALLLLVLLTIAAVGMSRNSFREIVSSGFNRQGAMANNVSDSGLDWAVYWLQNAPTAANPSAQNLVALKNALGKDNSLEGVAKSITDATGGTAYAPGGTVPTDLAWSGPTGSTEGYTIGLTRMGKLPITGMSNGSGPGAYAPASGSAVNQQPDLWAVRSDAQITQGGVTFTHGKEAWISTPITQQ